MFYKKKIILTSSFKRNFLTSLMQVIVLIVTTALHLSLQIIAQFVESTTYYGIILIYTFMTL